MKHLNTGDGFSGTDAYQTWDHVQCQECKAIAVEFYYTCFVKDTDFQPKIEIVECIPEINMKEYRRLNNL